MSYTRAQIQTLLSQRLGDNISGTATGGAAAGATLTTTDLLRQPGATYSARYCQIDSLVGGGPAVGTVRLINTATVSSGVFTLTPYNAFPSQLVNTQTFSIHRFDPVWKDESINEALRELHAMVPPVVLEHLITGECIRNGEMEFWRDSANAYDWTASGTIAKETTIVYTGLSSLKMVSGAAATVKQPINLTRELYGVPIVMTAYVYQPAAADSGTKIRLTQANTDTDSTALTVAATWTKLTVNLTVAEGRDPIYATLVQGNTANATYWDQVRLLVPSSSKSSVDWLPYSDYYAKLHQVQYGYQQGVTTKSVVGGFQIHSMPEYYADNFARWPYGDRFNVPYWVKLIGTGRYPNLTASTDTIEVNQEEARLLAALAAIKVIEKAESYELPIPKDWTETKKKELGIEINILTKTINRPIPTLYQSVPRR